MFDEKVLKELEEAGRTYVMHFNYGVLTGYRRGDSFDEKVNKISTKPG